MQQVETDAVMCVSLMRNGPYAAVTTTSGLHFIVSFAFHLPPRLALDVDAC